MINFIAAVVFSQELRVVAVDVPESTRKGEQHDDEHDQEGSDTGQTGKQQFKEKSERSEPAEVSEQTEVGHKCQYHDQLYLLHIYLCFFFRVRQSPMGVNA